MHDGSRHFGELPQRLGWYAMRDHVPRLPGAKLTEFLCDGVTEAWIEFAYEGHAFTINNQLGEYWFFVADPACPEATLRAVLEHFATRRPSSS
jgi:hypothetical protein